MSYRVHFSIDDVLHSFLWLERNDKESIFDADTFLLAKWLYENYGVNTTYNCFYQSQRGSLRDVSDKYRKQIEDSIFLKFSFHGKDDITDYNNVGYGETASDYKQTTAEIIRIAGEDALSDVVRLHYFHGSAATVRALEDLGVKLLLTADDDRGSYDLKPDEEQTTMTGIYYKAGCKIGYKSTDIRLERFSVEQLSSYDYDREKTLVVFTHENLAARQETKEKLSALMRHIGETRV